MHQENLVEKLPEQLTASEQARVGSAIEIAAEQKRKDEAGIKLAELEHKLRLEQARIAPQPPVTLTLEQAKAAGLTVMESPPPARTDARSHPSRTDTHYDEVGKVRWALKSQLATLQTKRFCFGADAERRDISLAITHIEDALHRLERVIDNHSTSAC